MAKTPKHIAAALEEMLTQSRNRVSLCYRLQETAEKDPAFLVEVWHALAGVEKRVPQYVIRDDIRAYIAANPGKRSAEIGRALENIVKSEALRKDLAICVHITDMTSRGELEEDANQGRWIAGTMPKNIARFPRIEEAA